MRNFDIIIQIQEEELSCNLFQVVHECNDSALIEGRRKEYVLIGAAA